MSQCHCGLAQKFSDCCQPYLSGEADAPTPEALMRSRYSAFVEKNLDYIFETTDPQARADFDLPGTREWAEQSKFVKLEVLTSTNEGNKGSVEFKAHFHDKDGNLHVHHEMSKFRKQGGLWYFRDGRMVNPSK